MKMNALIHQASFGVTQLDGNLVFVQWISVDTSRGLSLHLSTVMLLVCLIITIKFSIKLEETEKNIKKLIRKVKS